MTLLLGFLLGAENAAARAVFQALRRSSAQRDAISEAANAGLTDPKDKELVGAILNAHKSVEVERNAIVHGHFGVADDLPDALIWQTTNDNITIQSDVLLARARWSPQQHEKLLSSLSVYRKADLEKALSDIKEIGGIWGALVSYLKSPNGQAYRRLCDQPRVAQELENIRRKK